MIVLWIINLSYFHIAVVELTYCQIIVILRRMSNYHNVILHIVKITEHCVPYPTHKIRKTHTQQNLTTAQHVITCLPEKVYPKSRKNIPSTLNNPLIFCVPLLSRLNFFIANPIKDSVIPTSD